MSWDEIKFKFTGVSDFGNIKKDAEDVVKSINGMKQSFADMPNFTRIMDNSLEKTATIASGLGETLDKLSDENIKGEKRTRLEKEAETAISELNSYRNLRTGNNTGFSVQLAHDWFGQLPSAIRHELDAVTPEVSNIIRSKISNISKSGTKITGSRIESIVQQFVGQNGVKDKDILDALKKHNVSSEAAYQLDDYLKYLLPNIISGHYFAEYQKKKYGSVLPEGKNYFDRGEAIKLLPESYRASWGKRYQSSQLTPEQAKMVLRKDYREKLDELFSNNPIAVRAAQAAGISRRDARGVLETREEITHDQWEQFRNALYEEMVARTAGMAKGHLANPYEHISKLDRKTIAERLTQSSSGQAVNAMHDIEGMNSADAWIDATGNRYWRKNHNEPKRALDSYVVTKYSPFERDQGYGYHKDVEINESQATRVLGQGTWKHNDDVSNVIRLVSLAGYDKNNKEHSAELRNLIRNGKEFDGVQFVVDTIHSGSDGPVVRMLAKNERDEANRRVAQWAGPAGFTGTYFGNFSDNVIQEIINGADPKRLTAKMYGKHYESLNKKWSPSADLGLNTDGIRIAVVDTNGQLNGKDIEFGDGAMWASREVVKDPFQTRIGAAGKGSTFVFTGKNLGAAFEKWGLLDEQGRAMVKGPNGEYFNAADANVMLPLSMIKNQMAYMKKNDDGTYSFRSNEEISKMAEAEVKNLGWGEMVNYNKEDHHSDNIGVQQMSFLNFSPETRMHQIEMALKRMREIETEAGQLKYVFGDQNDWFSRQVNKNTQLLGTDQAKAWVDNYRAKMIQDIVSGKFFDFGEGDTKFASAVAAANPLATVLQSMYSGNMSGMVSRAREILKDTGFDEQLSDQEIEDLIVLKSGNVVDFSNQDQERLTLLRSPSGYGNILKATNKASDLTRALYEGFGIDTSAGVYMSEEDRDILQGIDFDSDHFKIIKDPKLVKEIEELTKNQIFSKQGIETTVSDTGDLKDQIEQAAQFGERSIDKHLAMGTGASGVRGMMLDLTNPVIAERYIPGMQMLQTIYDYGSTEDKNPRTYKTPQAAWDVQNLQKEFTKFTDHASELFRYDDDMFLRDENGELTKDLDFSNPDLFRPKNSNLPAVNMRALRDMGVDAINAPSVNMANQVMGLAFANMLYRNGMSDTTRWDAISEAMEALEYNTEGPARKELMHMMRKMLPEWASGKRGRIDEIEESAIQEKIDNAKAELEEEANKSWNSEAKSFVSPSGTKYRDVQSYVAGEGRKYSIQTATQMLDMFGFTSQFGSKKLGEDFFENLFQNFGVADIVSPSIANYAKQKEAIVKQLEEARAKQQQEENVETTETKAQPKTEPKEHKPVFSPVKHDYSQGFGPNQSKHEVSVVDSVPAISPQSSAGNRVAELEKQLEALEANQAHKIEVQTRHQQLMSDAREISQQIHISALGNENKLKGQSLARSYWNRQRYGVAGDILRELDAEAEEKQNDELLSEKEKEKLQTDIENRRRDIYRNLTHDFVAKAEAYTKQVADSITNTINNTEDKTTQKKNLDNIDESIKESKEFEEELKNRMTLNREHFSQEDQDLYGQGLLNVRETIAKQQTDRARLVDIYTAENEKNATLALESLQEKLGLRDRNSIEVQVQNRKELIQKQKDLITKNHSEGLMTDQYYENQIALLSQYDSSAASDIIKENRIALGLDEKTPQQKADEWMQKRLSVIQEQRDLANNADARLQSMLDGQHSQEEIDKAIEDLRAATENYDPAKLDQEEEQTRKQAAYMATAEEDRRAFQHQQRMDDIDYRNQMSLSQQQRRYKQHRRYRGAGYGLSSRFMQHYYQESDYRTSLQDEISRNDREAEKTQAQIDRWEKEKEAATGTHKQELQNNIDEATKSLEGYKAASSAANEELSRMSKGSLVASAAMQTLGESLTRVAQRLGRQLFHKAIQEARRFVKEFDSSMNEIQAITLKSNEDMQGIRSQTISKAIGLRTSVSNVSNVEAALYRQGLSDEEVSTRTESIIKFATVTKLNVQEATKIITTALQNDLVPSAEAAMDALVALGDSAATTAAEIGKGMQKAAASAKVAGVSYAELTALLTIGTSDTQLSGTQVGTALQTVFTRMRRMSQSGWAADQNGTKTTASDAEAALKSVGIDLFDDKAQGKMRSAYDILLDLSKVWQTLSDVQKSIVTSALAGTRQTNIFSTLMEGMSEDNGKTLEKYLGLAEGSEGITQSKYEIAMQSLAAALDELKSSWDAVVESFTNGGLITGVLDGFSSFLQNIASVAENGGQIGLVFSMIAGGITMLAAKCLLAETAIAPIAGFIGILAGLGVSLLGAGFTEGLTGLISGITKTDEQFRLEEANKDANRVASKADYNKTVIDNRKKAIENVEKAGAAWNKVNSIENENALRDALDNLLILFPDLSAVIGAATSDLTKWKTAVEDAKNISEQFVKDTASASFVDYFTYFRTYFKDILQNSTAGINTAPISKGEALKGLNAAALNAPVHASYSPLARYDNDVGVLSTIWNNKDYASTKAVATEYLSAYNQDALALLNDPNKNMDGSYNKKAYTEEELDILAAAFTGFESYLNTPDSPYVAISEVGKKIKSEKNSRYNKVASAYFKDDGSFAFEGYENEGIENKADLFRMLFYSGNKDVKSYFSSLFPNVDDSSIYHMDDSELAGYMDTVVAGMSNTKSTRAMRMASTKAVQSEVEKSMPFQTLANDEFSEEILRNAFSSWVGNLLEEDYAKEEKDRKYFNADGTLNLGELTRTIEGKAYSIIYSDEEKRKFVNENASDEFFYTVGNATDNNGNKMKFTSVEKAAEYARKNGYEYTDIKDSNGNTAYMTANKAVDALVEKTKSENKTAENLTQALDIIKTSKNMDEVLAAYNKEGLGQEFANVLGTSPELLAAYRMYETGKMSWEEFQNAATNTGVGRTNKVGVVESVLEQVARDKSFATTLRTDPIYAGVYATFKDVLGDAGEAVLNAIEDGVSDPEAMRMLNQALVSQRIKEAMQFNRYYDEAVKYAVTAITGSDAEKAELSSSTKTELQQYYDYIDALNRYNSGKALSSDYGIIASYDKRFTETELRNNASNEEFRSNVNVGRDLYGNNLSERYQARYLALLAAAGLTPYDLTEEGKSALDELTVTEEQAKLLAQQAGLSPSDPHYLEAIAGYMNTGYTKRQAAEKISPTIFSDIELLFGKDSPFNVLVDEKGNVSVTLKEGSALRLSGESTISQIKQNAIETSAKPIYGKILPALRSGTRANTSSISTLLGDEEFNRLIANDPMFGYLLAAGADQNEIMKYVENGSLGIKGNVFDQYDLGWNTLFSGNRELNRESIIGARTAYQNIAPEDQPYFNAFLNELPQELRDVITGKADLTNDAIEEILRRYEEFRLRTVNSGKSTKELAGIVEGSIVKHGTKEEQRSLMTGKVQQGQAIQQANYALENFNSDTVGYIASLLEMPEELVRETMEQEGGKDALKEMIQGKSEDFIESIANAFDIDLTDVDPSSYADLLHQKAEELGGEIGNWLNRIADMLDEEGKFVAKSGYSSFDVVAEQRLKTQREHTSVMNVAGNIIRNGNYEEIGSNKDVNWNALGEGLFYMMNDRRINGANSVFTDEMINAAYTQELLNGQLSPESEMSIINSIFGEANTPKERIQKYRELMSDEEGNAAQISALRSISGFEPVLTALANGTIDKVDTEWQQFNKNFSPRQIEYLGLYGDASSDVAGYITQIGKSSKTSTQAIGTLVTKMSNLSYLNIIIPCAAGKSGKQLSSSELDVISAVTSIPKELLKTYGSDMMASVLKGANESIADQWETEVAAPLIAQINSTFENADENKKLQISRAIEFNYDAETGALNVAGLAEMVKDLDSELYRVLLAYADSGATLTANFFENGNDVGYVLELKEAKAGTKGAKTGGGGGGKSAADKLIEAQKHKVAELEHESKMLQIDETRYDKLNDYDNYISTIDKEIDVQKRLEAQYAVNIQKMNDLLAKTKEGSDDWWKLKESINSTEEAMKSVGNTIDELNAKNITMLSKQQDIQDKSGTHVQNMLEKLASRAMSEDRFNDYASLIQDQIKAIQAQKDLNDAQIEEWKAQLSNYVESSDSWLEVRDKIWALEEENAELENKALQQTTELNEQRLSQIGKIVQENTQTAVHNQNIASTYGSLYQNGGYRNQYEEMLRAQIDSNASIKEQNDIAAQSVLEQMSTLEAGTTAWFNAQAALYSYQEAAASATATQYELNRALAESNLESVAERYTDATREIAHVNEMLSTQAQNYLENNDYEAYYAATERIISNMPALVEEARSALNQLWSDYYQGMEEGNLDPAMQRQYLDEINNRENTLQNLLLDYQKKQKEIDNTALDRMLEQYDEGQSNYDHNLKLLGYESSIYQNAGEWTNYGNMIATDSELRAERIVKLGKEIDELERKRQYYQEKYGEGTDEEKRIVEQIKKREEALASENTQIEKNNKLLEENQKKIIQIRKTLQDAVDKEIEDQKRREREILSANVSMQNTIVDILRKSLQDQWNLRKKDLQNEKDTLNEYKKLINERFNYRKKAAQQADQDEEIADVRRTLALLEADPTKTREAKETRRRLEELEKSRAMTIAEDELAAENERIDQQTEGIDKFVQYNEELLNEILGDANNFSTEMNEILSGSFEESYSKILEYMSKENEAFMKSLPAAQQQMIQSWEDTWKKASDIIDNNYPFISMIIGNKESYMDYMKATDRMYRSYTENGDETNVKLLETQWSEYYDNYLASIKDTAMFNPDDHTIGEVTSKIDELKDNIFNVNIIGISGKAPGPEGLSGDGTQYIDFSHGDGYNPDDYAGTGKIVTPEPAMPTSTISNGNGKKDENSSNKDDDARTYIVYGTRYDGLHQQYGKGFTINEAEEARTKAEKRGWSNLYIVDEQTGKKVSTYSQDNTGSFDNALTSFTNGLATGLSNLNTTHGYEYVFNGKNYSENGFDERSAAYRAAKKKIDEQTQALISKGVSQDKADIAKDNAHQSLYVYKHGGLVDYTGTAWVDGTPQRPESFLDSTDTSLLRSVLDQFKYSRVSPFVSHIDPSMLGNNTTIGDINITINQASLGSETDINKVAKQVGRAFTKELKINGLNLAGYSFA